VRLAAVTAAALEILVVVLLLTVVLAEVGLHTTMEVRVAVQAVQA